MQLGHPGPEPRHPQPSVATCEGWKLNEVRDQPPPIGMKHSYAGAVKGTQGANLAPHADSSLEPPIHLEFIKPHEENGRVKVMPPHGLSAVGCSIWENTLVGYFIGQRLAYPVVNSIAHRLWDSWGLEEVLSSDSGFYFFQFKNEENLGSVLDRAPWHMANRPLVLKRWPTTLSFQSSDKVPLLTEKKK